MQGSILNIYYDYMYLGLGVCRREHALLSWTMSG